MATPLPKPEQMAEVKTTGREDRARLDGVRLAARTLEHHLLIDLTLTVGYSELLAEDPELPLRLREMAQQVLDNARAAVESVRRLRRVDSIKLAEQDLPGGPLLEL
jgi:hypothetical protein